MIRQSQDEVIPFISKLEELDLVDEAELLYRPPPRPWTVLRVIELCATCLRELGAAFPWLLHLLLRIILPSYLQKRETEATIAKLRSTAYLDSLRGVAALIVVIHHWTYVAWFENEGFAGGERSEKNRYVTQLPIVRLIHTGAPMVAIFFVISGYVLSIKPLKLIRRLESGDSSRELLKIVSASVLRRWFRLFVPVIVSTLMVVVMLQLYWYQSTDQMSRDIKILSGDWEDQPVRYANCWDELKRWSEEMAKYVHSYNKAPVFDEHLWTIAIEWQCSLRLYFCLFLTSCMTYRTRTGFLVFLSTWAWCWGHWELTEFWCGAVLAERHIIREEKHEEATALGQESTELVLKGRLRRQSQFWWSLNLVSGLYLMSYPPVKKALAVRTPGYMTLAMIVPDGFTSNGKYLWSDQYRLWHAIGAMQCIWSVGCLHRLRTGFASRPLKYLGDISYSLYIVHGPIFHTLGYNMIKLCWTHITGHDPMSRYSLGIVLGALPTVPVVFYMADRFKDLVDLPAIKFSKIVQHLVLPLEINGN